MRDYKALVDQVLKDLKEKQDDTSNSNQMTNITLPLLVAFYSGFWEPFHKYYVWNGKKQVWLYKKRLNMAKRVAEDWASLLMSEKVQVVSKDQDTFIPLLKELGFWHKANNAVEVGFGLGYAGLTVDLDNLKVNDNGVVVKDKDTRIKLNYYNATKVVPITIIDKEFVECAFVSENTNELCVNLHIRDLDGFYHIVLYRMKKSDKSETITDIKTTSKKRLFTIIQPNIANNIFINSDYPISIFANAIDILKSLDDTYDAFDNEIVLGRKRLFVSADLNAVSYDAQDSEGNITPHIKSTFDPNDTLIYGLPTSGAMNDNKPQVFSPTDPLRVDQLVMALNQQLKVLSQKCGLGNDYYNFDKATGNVTATQVISEKSDTFRNMKKHELLLEKSLVEILEAIIYCNNEYTLNPTLNTETPQIIFDDSVIEDREAEQKRDERNLANGSMSLVEYRMKYFGEDEEKAKEVIYEINGREGLVKRLEKYLQAFNAGLMTPKMFVNLAYTDEDLKKAGVSRDELIEMLSGSAYKPNDISIDEVKSQGGYQPTEPTEQAENDKNLSIEQ